FDAGPELPAVYKEYVEVWTDWEGEGTESEPYIVDQCLKLTDMVNHDPAAYYLLDDDLTCFDIVPIGYYESDSFSGTFDGGGNTLTYSVDIYEPGNGGLFL